MKKALYLWLLFFFPVLLSAQGSLRTIVPTDQVFAGEAFRVQYILENGSDVSQFITPDFKNLRIVSGPATYSGEKSSRTGIKQTTNYVFTLLALSPGKYQIPGAIILIDGKKLKWSDSFLEVKTKTSNSNKEKNERMLSDYFLRPGENVSEKIRKNLFIKVTVDKKNCYTGEPVLATFKLYSRLETQSDIVKNPGFYGFTVFDMINLQDKEVNTEIINGENFNVHTIRKVQLFPLQPGRFFIDAMEINNKIKFSRFDIGKTAAEPEIVEGLSGRDDETMGEEGTEVYETGLKTETVEINVKPVLEKNKPGTFSGAVGTFTFSASVSKNVLSKNEEGVLEIIVQGKGNFQQLSSPGVRWPAGIEYFEPLVKDTFIRAKMPIEGSRVFRYVFISSKSGQFTLPAINFSFFNPDSGTYKTVSTKPIQVNIADQEKANTGISVKNYSKGKNTTTKYFIVGILLLTAGVFLYWLLKRKKQPETTTEHKSEAPPQNIIEELMSPSYLQKDAEGKLFFSSLYKAVWTFFTSHYNLSGSEVNKENLLVTMKKNGIDTKDLAQIADILQECETGMFTNANITKDRDKILEEIKEIFTRINNSLL